MGAESTLSPISPSHRRRWPVRPSSTPPPRRACCSACSTIVVGYRHRRTSRRARLLGEVWRFDSRFDLDEPQTLEAGPDGGLLRRPGQPSRRPSVVAFRTAANWCRRTSTGWSCPKGAPTQASSSRSRTPAGHTATSRRARSNRLESEGCGCSARWSAMSPRRLTCKRRPSSPAFGQWTTPSGWGYEKPGTLGHLVDRRWNPSRAFGARVLRGVLRPLAAAVSGVGAQPVPASEAMATLAVLDAARISAAEGIIVAV